MAMETDVILRSVLYHVMTAKTLKEAEIAIKNMCSKDLIAAVKASVEELESAKPDNPE